MHVFGFFYIIGNNRQRFSCQSRHFAGTWRIIFYYSDQPTPNCSFIYYIARTFGSRIVNESDQSTTMTIFLCRSSSYACGDEERDTRFLDEKKMSTKYVKQYNKLSMDVHIIYSDFFHTTFSAST